MFLLWTEFCISGQNLSHNESRNESPPNDELRLDSILINGAQIVALFPCPIKRSEKYYRRED